MRRSAVLGAAFEGDSTRTLVEPSVAIPAAAALDAVRANYGLEAELVPLRGERDVNFLIVVDGEPKYVLRLANPAEHAIVANFRTAALLHLERHAPHLPVPRVLPTKTGEHGFLWSGLGERRFGQVVGYLPGSPMLKGACSKAQCRCLGRIAAEISLALADFDHPGSGHALLWDLKHAGQATRYVPHIKTPEHLRLVNWALSRFETKVEPVLAGMRSQVIHNDLNPHNILVSDDDDREVVGIIDFGDMVHSALVNDVAVSCSYLIKEGAEPLAAVCDFLAAYCEVLPLLEAEYEILPELIATRLALTVVIANWRATRHPDNSDYILRNRNGAVEGLNILSELDSDEVRQSLRSAGMRGVK